MNLEPTALEGVFLARSSPVMDSRGAFSRFYCERELAPALGSRRVVQVNHSRTNALGAVRGMHLQGPPQAEMKFVRCLQGSVWDVVVDLRAGSPTLLQSHAQDLTAENGLMMVIPEGCAHGFQALAPGSEMLYLHTAFYVPEAERGFSCIDPRFQLKWPRTITELSQRDAAHPPIDVGFAGIAA